MTTETKLLLIKKFFYWVNKMWKMTDWGITRNYHFILEQYLFCKTKDWMSEGSSFVLPEMGEGHFYLEKEHIYYNPSCRKSFCDGAVAEWKND